MMENWHGEIFVCRLNYKLCFTFFLNLIPVLIFSSAFAQQNIRQDISLNKNWHSIADNNIRAQMGFEQAAVTEKKWMIVNVPHNWDTYEGYRRLKHGNKHGYAWYRKTFSLTKKQPGKKYFLWFEGVGSYATVWLNGKQVGYHAGGRTSFTVDVTDAIKAGEQNLLCVRADHPAYIRDLPWVCGGCSDDPGFSEGSQPMGIFRPVHLIITSEVRIQPFGVHIWNDTTVSERSATLHLETEVKNYSSQLLTVKIINKLVDEAGNTVARVLTGKSINPGVSFTLRQELSNISHVHLWSPQHAYLYKVVTQIWKEGRLTDQIITPYGIRWISWPIGRNNGDNRFYVNGKPVFINGIAEYEHLMGKSHAFSNEEIEARVIQVKAAGFNAFRDAHQPHNLLYSKYWDKLGILWWPQYSAHIWFDTPEFRANFKALLIDWIKERRNSPSVILWGLQNESKLPADFARECTELIRKLDPTASSQRKITTCNGGDGTDWNVPQNWTGTYGGDPATYGQDLKKEILVGEYGAWRSIGLHTEGPFIQNGPLSENRMAGLLETKVKLAESVKDKVAGHFQWLLYSHENPGRVQGGEGWRELDRVGPVNYKGLFTVWGQPTDAFYMYRANYAPKDKEPMVYIVSHTWPDRWLVPGKKDGIIVYSNCDEVELFNDRKNISLGKKKRHGIGTHFQWDGVAIRYNVLYAVGYVNGKAVAHDEIVLNHLPDAPHLKNLILSKSALLKPAPGYNYLYRMNCGGPDYKDSFGNLWLADRHQQNKNMAGSLSWTDDYSGAPAFFASQQRSFDKIDGTSDSRLFQNFRYGMDKLRFNFPVPNGDYRVELYFTEPWYGAGGGLDCTGWRLFDVAVNGQIKLHNLDIWKNAGYGRAFKKVITAHVTGDTLSVSFPNAAAGEAVISAIAISTLKPGIKSSSHPGGIIGGLQASKKWSLQTWMDIGQKEYTNSNILISELPPALYGADWIETDENITDGLAQFTVNADAYIYIAMDTKPAQRPAWLNNYETTGLALENDYSGGHKLPVYRKRFNKGQIVLLGPNQGNLMFTVAVLPINTLAPAVDLRKTARYKVDNAELTGNGVVKDTLNGKTVARFIKNDNSSVLFAINPGVADIYNLRIKYYNTGNKILKAKMQIQAANGLVMKDDIINFKPVPKNKSGTVETTTGTSINAGNYKIIITGLEATGLSLSGLEMQ